MKATDIPSYFPKPFADGAGSGYINPIPTASQIGITDGAASLTDGFPPLTFTPKASGGVPPFGADFNGILNQTTAVARWIQAGGLSVYDATFSTAIGGYPSGAVLVRADGGGFWISTADDNTTDPDTGGAGWNALGMGRSAPTGYTRVAPNRIRQDNYSFTAFSAYDGITALTIPAPSSDCTELLIRIAVVFKSVSNNTLHEMTFQELPGDGNAIDILQLSCFEYTSPGTSITIGQKTGLLRARVISGNAHVAANRSGDSVTTATYSILEAYD